MPLAARFHPDYPYFVTAPFRPTNVHCGEYATFTEAQARADALYRRMLSRPHHTKQLELFRRTFTSKARYKAQMLSRLARLAKE